MKLEKTTVMSAIIWVTGILAEIVFHDALSKSIFGIILGILIAIIVITATYFILDGINTALFARSKDMIDKQLEKQEQMFNALNSRIDEQLKSGQAVYEKLDDIIAVNKKYMEKTAEGMFTDSQDLTLKKAVDEINTHTLQSAKIIVKYQMKNSTELKDTLDLILDQLSEVK